MIAIKDGNKIKYFTNQADADGEIKTICLI